MTIMKPFQSIRPRADLASRIAALPYDVYNSSEAREVVSRNEFSFLKIDRAETLLPEGTDMYSPQVYEKAKVTLERMIEDGAFVQDMENCYYIYELTMDECRQTGLVGCASIDDYLNGTIKKHENTREDKELDRISHVDTLSAQTGPIFLAYRAQKELNALIQTAKAETPIYDFISEDGIGHRVWMISHADIVTQIGHIFDGIPALYIADGHHRAASAVKVGLKRREENPDFDGSEEFNYFLSVAFPDEELRIFDYNRVVKDLRNYSPEEFMTILRESFEITPCGKTAVRPNKKGCFGMYLDGSWYQLELYDDMKSDDPVDGLDVSLLQTLVLSPILGIRDPKTDERIRFVGGIRGLDFLSSCVDEQSGGVAFSMYPTSMAELLAVADAGRLMPPKSTWFEPKLRSGLFIHSF
ncbi:MAG: DUF1015 family protein [Hespellia sp.]|nr:DUF1015 family protein [Hespellia sp.]